MNNGKIWCVVNPTVGIPIFLGAVAVASLAVHFSILTNTTWFPAFFGG
jgi:light-harvesting protein B-800-850 alpha chain